MQGVSQNPSEASLRYTMGWKAGSSTCLQTTSATCMCFFRWHRVVAWWCQWKSVAIFCFSQRCVCCGSWSSRVIFGSPEAPVCAISRSNARHSQREWERSWLHYYTAGNAYWCNLRKSSKMLSNSMVEPSRYQESTFANETVKTIRLIALKSITDGRCTFHTWTFV